MDRRAIARKIITLWTEVCSGKGTQKHRSILVDEMEQLWNYAFPGEGFASVRREAEKGIADKERRNILTLLSRCGKEPIPFRGIERTIK